MNPKELNLPNLSVKKVSEEELIIEDPQVTIEWIKRRAKRVTGSNYSKIKFRIVRAESEKRKSDYLDFINSRGKAYLLEKKSEELKKPLNKLTIADIKPIYYSIEGRKELTTGAKTYLNKLVGQNIIGYTRETISAKSLDWGNKNEPKGIKAYQLYIEEKYPEKYTFERSGFDVNPNNPLLGSSSDLKIFLKGLKDPEGVLELKCSIDAGKHAERLSSDWFDEFYEGQLLGYFVNIPSLKWVDFASFEPEALQKENQLYVHRMYRADFEDRIQELRERLDFFCEEYTKRLKKCNIELELYN